MHALICFASKCQAMGLILFFTVLEKDFRISNDVHNIYTESQNKAGDHRDAHESERKTRSCNVTCGIFIVIGRRC